MTHDSFPALQAHFSHSTENHKPDKLSFFVAIFTAHFVFDRIRKILLSCTHKAKGHRPPLRPIVPQSEIMVHVHVHDLLNQPQGPLMALQYDTLKPCPHIHNSNTPMQSNNLSCGHNVLLVNAANRWLCINMRNLFTHKKEKSFCVIQAHLLINCFPSILLFQTLS